MRCMLTASGSMRNRLMKYFACAREGMPVVLKKMPRQPGRRQDGVYDRKVENLLGLAKVVDDLAKTCVRALC